MESGGDPDVGAGIGSVGGGEPASAVWGPAGDPDPEPNPMPDPDASGGIGSDAMGGTSPGSPVRWPGYPPGVEPADPCNGKCQTDYENAAAVCGRMENSAQRNACQDRAYATYKSCRAACQASSGDPDCLELCKEKCDAELARCRDACKRRKKADRPACYGACTEKYARSLKECEKRCK